MRIARPVETSTNRWPEPNSSPLPPPPPPPPPSPPSSPPSSPPPSPPSSSPSPPPSSPTQGVGLALPPASPSVAPSLCVAPVGVVACSCAEGESSPALPTDIAVMDIAPSSSSSPSPSRVPQPSCDALSAVLERSPSPSRVLPSRVLSPSRDASLAALCMLSPLSCCMPLPPLPRSCPSPRASSAASPRASSAASPRASSTASPCASASSPRASSASPRVPSAFATAAPFPPYAPNAAAPSLSIARRRSAGLSLGCISGFHQPGTRVGHCMRCSTASSKVSSGTRAVGGGSKRAVP